MPTIDEAIKLLQQDLFEHHSEISMESNHAKELSIEALKRIVAYRQYQMEGFDETLPGETEE